MTGADAKAVGVPRLVSDPVITEHERTTLKAMA